LIKYQITDTNPYNGISYYRLKQTDFNGRFQYSNIVSLEFFKDENGVSIYPNPSKGIITIDFKEEFLGHKMISISNVYGQKIVVIFYR
jgi:hypothetical protein